MCTLVLGIPHSAVATRDVALYMPFKNAIRLPNAGLQTLAWQLMRRRCQDGHLHPVGLIFTPASIILFPYHRR